MYEYNPNNVNWEKVKEGLNKYIAIMDSFYKLDVSIDANFKKRFNGFYRIKQRPQQFYHSLYSFLEENKNNNKPIQKGYNSQQIID